MHRWHLPPPASTHHDQGISRRPPVQKLARPDPVQLLRSDEIRLAHNPSIASLAVFSFAKSNHCELCNCYVCETGLNICHFSFYLLCKCSQFKYSLYLCTFLPLNQMLSVYIEKCVFA